MYQIQLDFSNIISNNKSLTIMWSPSHCDIKGNEIADSLAKQGAKNSTTAVKININLDVHEYYYLINKTISEKLLELHKSRTNTYSENCVINTKAINPKLIWKTPSTNINLTSKLRLNTFKTNCVQPINCICNQPLTIQHLFLQRPIIKYELLLNYKIDITSKTLAEILNSISILHAISKIILSKPLANKM